MRIVTLRDWFWLTVVVAIIAYRYSRIPEFMACPCCNSSYPTELVRSIDWY